MGQMTMAVMLGVDAGEAPESLEEGWYTLVAGYKAKGIKPDSSYDDRTKRDMVGFWIACGASGKDGVPDLVGFALDGFLDVPMYAKQHDAALKAWEKFAAWVAKRGHKFGVPKLWLVETEVA